MQKTNSTIVSMARQLSKQHAFLFHKQEQTLKAVGELRQEINAFRELLVPDPAAPGMKAPAETKFSPLAASNRDEPIPVQDLDLVERVGMYVNDLDEVLLCMTSLAASASEGATVECVNQSQARLRGLRAEIVTLLKMRDIHLVETIAQFDPLRHRPLATKPRPAGVEGAGEVKRLGLTYRVDGKERVLKPALVVLYDDVKV
jgi:hypothetical protein